MKNLPLLLLFIIIGSLVLISSCKDDDDEPSLKDQRMDLLTGKSGGWSGTVTVPAGTATSSDQWSGFRVTFSSTNMTTVGQPQGAAAVWPSGGFRLSDDGNRIIRSADNVEMNIVTLTATNLVVRFNVPAGTVISGRVAALDGEYTFNLN
ncbi:MAG: hypothetical protein JJU28_09260 [Cyclobacteriaceae bacterium]|nr:hypothetical protein [Cyclobacteriaceae bacterium]